MIRVDRRTGAAERIAPSVSPWPAPRVRPAVALGSGGAELIVFGGTAHGIPLTDAWAYVTVHPRSDPPGERIPLLVVRRAHPCNPRRGLAVFLA